MSNYGIILQIQFKIQVCSKKRSMFLQTIHLDSYIIFNCLFHQFKTDMNSREFPNISLKNTPLHSGTHLLLENSEPDRERHSPS